MACGDPAAWASRFRSVDSQFLHRVAAVWPQCLARLPEEPLEDEITITLVKMLERDPLARRLFYYIEFHFEPFGYALSDGRARSLGEIDIAVRLDRDRDTYLAYECKRLNVRRPDGRRSLSTEYVTQGLSRFVQEQYSEMLPVGCMLGYVLDGDIEHALRMVQEKIVSLRGDVGLIDEPQSEVAIGVASRFYSRHRRSTGGGEIEVRHALLPM